MVFEFGYSFEDWFCMSLYALSFIDMDLELWIVSSRGFILRDVVAWLSPCGFEFVISFFDEDCYEMVYGFFSNYGDGYYDFDLLG